MYRILVCLMTLLLLSLAACVPTRGSRQYSQHPSGHTYYNQRGARDGRCGNTCVRWVEREQCERYGRRCHPVRSCVQYACR